METPNNPGDCQAAAADSTTAENSSKSSNLNSSGGNPSTSPKSLEQVSSTTSQSKTGSPPPGANNGKNKQLQQQQQQHYQFRTPQQFVRQRRSHTSANSSSSSTVTSGSSLNNKKNKTWNKRQNKTTKQHQQQQQLNIATENEAGGSVATAELDGVAGLTAPTKADLENIQNVKNQAHYYHHQHHHHHHHHHRLGATAMGTAGGSSNTASVGTAASEGRNHIVGAGGGGGGLMGGSTAVNEKLSYGHGHVKQQQQIYKKMMPHRGGHHNHVLCAGAAHNSMGVGGGCNGSGHNAALCCLSNGCNHAKDLAASTNGSIGLNSSNISNAANALHYCCGRSKFFLPDKRPRKEVIIPPTKFLLGGNISDPLNLSSLQNESSNTSLNNTPATTPRQSPITTPPKVEVIIPPNIHDPLHLLDPVDSMEYEKQLTSPMKRGQRGVLGILKSHKRHRKNRKPKRRRHESHNSNTNPLDLEEMSLLTNSTMSTEGSLMESSTLSVNISTSEIEADKTHSPQARNTALLLSPLSEHNVQQHVAITVPSIMEGAENKVSALNNDILPSSNNRAAAIRDLRLDLSTCGGNILPTATSATNAASSGLLIAEQQRGPGRKRKTSESNNSVKNKKFHRDSMDKIVSPVVPQPGAWKRPPRLVSGGARKPSRRSTSVSEPEQLSPADETKSLLGDETLRVETPDLSKMDNISEAGVGSPQSTTSGATSVAAGEQDLSLNDGMGDNTVSTLAEESAITITTTTAGSTAQPTNKKQISSANTPMHKTPKFRADGAKYRYGNYDRYASFRQLNEFMDVRLQVFQRHSELFQNKDILDIGCNVGHMTIQVARNLAPKSILGIDIDKELIARARQNLSMFVRIPIKEMKKEESLKEEAEDESKEPKEETKQKEDKSQKKPKKNRRKKRSQQQHQHNNNFNQHFAHHHHHHHWHHLPPQPQLFVDAKELFPVSFPLTYGGIPNSLEPHKSPIATSSTPGRLTGPLATPAPHRSSGNSNSSAKNDFPRNVYFRYSNYVLKDESLLCNDTQQYDLILCLSVTKWIHLNFGDAGLKLAFKRMFNQLRPGGKLILEAQNWASYKKKKNMTEEIYQNYSNIEFFPNKFHEYLLSSEVGFSHSYTLGVPRHLNKGFCRPIQLYAKGDYTPNHVRWSDAYYPQTPYEAYRGIYATMPPRPPGLVYPHSSTRSQAYDTPHYSGGASGPYSCRQTPMHQPTSQYYNPLETDSYLPSYDMEYLNHMYVFASPLYQTVWSPPASLRNSSSHTPVFGSVRDAEIDGDGSGSAGGGSYHRHVYPPNEDTSSPNARGAFNSIRDPDTDDSNQLPASSVHVYATNCGESSSSPQVNHHADAETLDEALLTDEEQQQQQQQQQPQSDLNEA